MVFLMPLSDSRRRRLFSIKNDYFCKESPLFSRFIYHILNMQYAYLSTVLGKDRSRLISLSTLFCFLINCIFLARSASESDRRITKSSGASFETGGIGGRRNVNDSSTWDMSKVVVCLRRGNATFTSILFSVYLACGLSSKSGVDVHDDGRFVGA